MQKNVLITGASSGIGLALARESLRQGHHVFALQRGSSELAGSPGFSQVTFDLSQHREGLPDSLEALLGGTKTVDLVILNAGRLGQIADLGETPLPQLKALMEVNTWANKSLLDALFASGRAVTQVVGISSGAAVSGNRGWGGYALSKAAFLMLLKLYAAEREATHFASFAPGLVDTAMQEYLGGMSAEQANRFPSVARIQAARGTKDMPAPDAAAARFLKAFEFLLQEPSGAFVDIRRWDKAPT